MKIRISGTNEQVDQATKASIQQRYSIEDEVKILRRAILALSNGEQLPIEFIEYNDFVERVVAKRKTLKNVMQDSPVK